MVSGIFIYLSFANVLQGRKSTACVQLQGPFVLVARRETLPAAATNFLPSQVSLSYRLVKLSLVRGDMRSDLMSSKLDFLKPWLKSFSARRLTLIIILTTTVMT